MSLHYYVTIAALQQRFRSVKPHVINVFSDIALAIEGDFDRYANVILGILKQAGEVNLSPENDDDDLKDYINNLRDSILQAYTGILQAPPYLYYSAV